MRQTGKTPKGLRVFEGKYVEIIPEVPGIGGKITRPGTYRDLSLIKELRQEQAKLAARREAKALAREVANVDNILDPVKPDVSN